MTRLRSRLTYANVMVTLLAVVVMGTGVAYAAVAAKNSVVSSSIKNGQVKTKDLAKGSVTAAKQRVVKRVRFARTGCSAVSPCAQATVLSGPGWPTIKASCEIYAEPGFAIADLILTINAPGRIIASFNQRQDNTPSIATVYTAKDTAQFAAGGGVLVGPDAHALTAAGNIVLTTPQGVVTTFTFSAYRTVSANTGVQTCELAGTATKV